MTLIYDPEKTNTKLQYTAHKEARRRESLNWQISEEHAVTVLCDLVSALWP